VRKNVASSTISYMDSHAEKMQSKRSIVGKFDDASGEDDMKYMRSIELYRDTTIIVLNKPPSMPVQGGIGIKYSIDALASLLLKYEYAESPRLVSLKFTGLIEIVVVFLCWLEINFALQYFIPFSGKKLLELHLMILRVLVEYFKESIWHLLLEFQDIAKV
ncbi:RNA pseudouridine synthase 4, mitochondrial, partial [Ananas comosus]